MTLERTNLPRNCLGVVLVFYGDELGSYIVVDEDTGILEAKADTAFINDYHDEPFYLPFDKETENINLNNKNNIEKLGYKDNIPDNVSINKALKESFL